MPGRNIIPSATLTIEDLMEPHDVAIESKSTWWLCLAKEELEPRIRVALNQPHLLAKLKTRYNLVCNILDERLLRGKRELPELKKVPKGGYHGNVCSN